MISALTLESSGLGLSPDQGTALCSWARHFSNSVSLNPGV